MLAIVNNFVMDAEPNRQAAAVDLLAAIALISAKKLAFQIRMVWYHFKVACQVLA